LHTQPRTIRQVHATVECITPHCGRAKQGANRNEYAERDEGTARHAQKRERCNGRNACGHCEGAKPRLSF
jgi:hypothetical protein